MMIFDRRAGWLLAATATLFSFGAHAQAAPEAPALIEALTGSEAATRGAPATIEGFRSAKFGMDEAAVRSAIESDFGVASDAIVESANGAERTRILTVDGVEVLDGGGPAAVSYVFGYESNTLGQVSVLWAVGGEGGEGGEQVVNADKLVANADVLQNYFLQSGYAADSVVVNVPVPEGLVVFRGSDAEGHMAVLLLRGTLAEGEAGADGAAAQPVLTPTNLLLAYLADPQKPDVFRVEPGQF
ncbi:hypothetical protein DYI37_00470 [Fulvimarina endophytica]|uniref:Uncharacterized protein n=1 Tax=Fulvimarina endophytica TaxID=2293836 RepID=A0A371X9T3_9HYPH|nr:hypothetical protein [Fulvimarina endophytica]RFC65993.1 hypothetical protein DYI37_00470 [Fulvimarina endophytica]